METTPTTIFQKMIAVMRDSEAVTKSKTNVKQGFKYRGIDDVYNMLHPIMAKHGIFMTTEVLSIKETERQSSTGGVLFYKQASIKFTFHAEDGSSVSSIVNGEAMDSGDKATNKAMAVAHKYCLFQAFCLPTEEAKDSDADTPEVEPDHKKELKDYVDLGISKGFKTACEKWLSDNLKGAASIDAVSNDTCKALLAKLTKDAAKFVQDPPMETVTPEVVAVNNDKAFTPYVKGGENVKSKEAPVQESKPPETPDSAKGTVLTLKESSAKLRDEYLVSIANLKTAENCRYLLSTMASKAGLFTDQDRKVLNAGFEAKRAEILAAEKAPEAPVKELEVLNIGDKVKVMTNGKVVLEGTIEKFGIVGGRRTVKLKEHATPVFADLCTKQ